MPVELTAVAKKRSDEELRPFSFEGLKGSQVVVVASGFTYRGELVGADEADLYLKGEMRWYVLPLHTVGEVKVAPSSAAPLRTKKPGFDEGG